VSFLLDTNVVSEWIKPRPNPGVVAWIADMDEDRVFLSVVTLAELRYGVERLAPGQRRTRLGGWLEDDLPLRFEGRILNIHPAVANACGRLVARAEAMGRPTEAMDAFIAATAEVHGLTVVTRNISDFQSLAKDVLDPWI
jgi:predicted nucleic acid-binding protein